MQIIRRVLFTSAAKHSCSAVKYVNLVNWFIGTCFLYSTSREQPNTARVGNK